LLCQIFQSIHNPFPLLGGFGLDFGQGLFNFGGVVAEKLRPPVIDIFGLGGVGATFVGGVGEVEIELYLGQGQTGKTVVTGT